jgi:hypothetical protein
VLHYTCAYKFPELTTYFLSKGADDTLANASGMTCYEAEVAGALDRSDVDNL